MCPIISSPDYIGSTAGSTAVEQIAAVSGVAQAFHSVSLAEMWLLGASTASVSAASLSSAAFRYALDAG